MHALPSPFQYAMPALAALTTLLAAQTAEADAASSGDRFALPSGLSVALQEIIWDTDEATGRFRFVAPELPAVLETSAPVGNDLMALCAGFVFPLMRALQPHWDQAVVSLASAPTVFGEYEPTVVQIFEGFEILDTGCEWGAF